MITIIAFIIVLHMLEKARNTLIFVPLCLQGMRTMHVCRLLEGIISTMSYAAGGWVTRESLHTTRYQRAC